MSAAFARSAARADPDVDEPGSFDDEGFDGKGVAELANQWALQQHEQRHSVLASPASLLEGTGEGTSSEQRKSEATEGNANEEKPRRNEKKEKKKKKRQGR